MTATETVLRPRVSTLEKQIVEASADHEELATELNKTARAVKSVELGCVRWCTQLLATSARTSFSFTAVIYRGVV